MERKKLGIWLSLPMLFAAFVGLWVLVDRMAARSLSEKVEVNADMWTSYFVKTVPEFDILLETGVPNDGQLVALLQAQEFADVFRFKLFAPDGRMTFLSDRLIQDNIAFSGTGLQEH